MEDENPNESGASKVLTSEQLQRLRDLQRRRLQIQQAQNAAIKKKKKKSKKKGKKGGSGEPESASTPPAETPPAAAAVKGFGQPQQRVRVDVASHSFTFTPPKDVTVSVAIQDPEDNSTAEQASKGDDAHGAEVAATQQALVVKQGGSSATAARGKRKKLHWGLDSKERWERKSNM